MKKIALIYLFLLGISTNAQFWYNSVRGNGNVITETRKISDFNKVTVTGSFHVHIFHGKTGDIKIETDENIMPLIETYTKGDELVIRFKKKTNIRKTTKLNVSLPVSKLSKIKITGSGYVKSNETFEQNKIYLTVTGSGDIALKFKLNELYALVTGSGRISLKGKTNEANYRVTGSGDIDAKQINSSSVEAKVTGSGDISAHANREIIAKVTGSGDIYYYGNPKRIKTKVLGSGSIRKK